MQHRDVAPALDVALLRARVSELEAERADLLARLNLTAGPLRRGTVLAEAEGIVDGPRRAHYGHPAENHGRTALYWNAYLGLDPHSEGAIDAHDVCQMNALQKISRESGPTRKPRRQRDTLVDQCGYARNAEIVDAYEESAEAMTEAAQGDYDGEAIG